MSRAGAVEAHRVDVAASAIAPDAFDYASAFEVTVPGASEQSAEEWARATFEEAPRAMRSFIMVGWRGVMGFRLGPRPSPDHVLGWKIVAAAPGELTLEVRSWLVSARKVVQLTDERVVMTTFVTYRRKLASAVWSSVTPIHHVTEPYLLGHAATRWRSQSS
jgi:hypothetical protein